MGENARSFIETWSFAEVATGIRKALAFLATSAAILGGLIIRG